MFNDFFKVFFTARIVFYNKVWFHRRNFTLHCFRFDELERDLMGCWSADTLSAVFPRRDTHTIEKLLGHVAEKEKKNSL